MFKAPDKKKKKNPKNSSGFTLVELLVVISIISLLSSILIVTSNSARAKANYTPNSSRPSWTTLTGADASAYGILRKPKATTTYGDYSTYNAIPHCLANQPPG